MNIYNLIILNFTVLFKWIIFNAFSPGNQCKKLLKNLDKLNIPDAFKEFKDVFQSLKDIHYLCNQDLLSHNYQEVIDNFRSSWFKLTDEYDISTTPKIHILLDHLEDYFDLTNITLKKVTDELCENMHQVLNKMLIKSMYFVKDVSNPNHGPRLLSAVKHLNSYNLYLANK